VTWMKSRLGGNLTAIFVYGAAFLGFWIVYNLTYQNSLLLSTLWADIAATIIVWIFGLIFKNSSLYDPYWSVAPLFILPFWLVVRQAGLGLVDWVLLLSVYLWGVRLTLNCIVRWRGLQHQDWRYTQLKQQAPRWWLVVNLGGIHLMPTLLVFGGMVPVYVAVFYRHTQNNFLLFLGGLACLSAMVIQLVADKQMDIFKKQSLHRDRYINTGVWRYSRHPNYFGEVLFWWGLWLVQISVEPSRWFTVVGPVLMTLLFVFISIPLMEKHILESKPSYVQYQQTVSVLVPWFRKNTQVSEKSA